MVQIDLVHHRGYAWASVDNSYGKGYLIDRAGKVHQGASLIRYFDDADDIEAVKQKLVEATGQFSIILSVQDKYILIGDYIRSFPLCYGPYQGGYIVSDDCIGLAKRIGTTIAPANLQVFKTAAFVTGKDTLFEGIWQVRAGELVVLDATAKSQFYFQYVTEKTASKSAKTCRNELKEVIRRSFERSFKLVGSKPVAIPLSGGYDSRLVALMAKEIGPSNIQCFTYGRKDTPEKTAAQQTAERLGLQWMFIEYNEDLIQGYFDDDQFFRYADFAGNGISMPFLQDYFAVKYLKDQSIISDDTIFIPGHSGDFLAGSHLQPTISPDAPLDTMANHLVDKHFSLLKMSKKWTANQRQKIKSELAKNKGLSYLQYENWDLKERQAKYIINSCQVFPFFGYQYLLPFWDTELIQYFLTLPYELKLFKKCYDEVLENEFFRPNDLIFTDELQPAPIDIKRQQFKNKLKAYLPLAFRKKLLENHDFVFYKQATLPMLDDLKSQNVQVDEDYRHYSAIITQWYGHYLLEYLTH